MVTWNELHHHLGMHYIKNLFSVFYVVDFIPFIAHIRVHSKVSKFN